MTATLIDAAKSFDGAVPILTIIGCCSVVYLIHMIHRIVTKSAPMHSATLYLRRLKQSGADMLGGDETDNVFVEESLILVDYVVPLLDVCVMKAIGQKLPILTRQEQLHFKMHQEGMKERKKNGTSVERWSWFYQITRILLLHSGKQIGYGCAGNAEATSSIWVYYPMVMPFSKGFMNDEYAFHSMEEIEHCRLTTDVLRSNVWVLTPLLTLPIMAIFYFILFLLPPVMKLITDPWLLVHPKTYFDLTTYYMAFIPTYVLTIIGSFLYWALPFRENDSAYEVRYEFFKKTIKDRGIQFDIIDQDTYTSKTAY